MTDRQTSITPQAIKTTKARGEVAIHIIGAVGEVGMLVAASLLLYTGSITQELWVGACMYALGGTVIGKARGKSPSSTTVGLVSLVPGLGAAASAAKGKGVLAFFAKLLPFALLFGCAGNPIEGVHDQLDAFTEVAQPAGEAVVELCDGVGELVLEVCPDRECYDGFMARVVQLCDPARDGFEVLVDAQAEARKALDTASSCLSGDAACLLEALSAAEGALQ